MKLKIEFSIDNAAFEDYTNEIPAILSGIAAKIEDNPQKAQPKTFLRDSNGNQIGHWYIDD